MHRWQIEGCAQLFPEMRQLVCIGNARTRCQTVEFVKTAVLAKLLDQGAFTNASAPPANHQARGAPLAKLMQ
jgi:hypothetical protein